MPNRQEDALIGQLADGAISRREFIRRAGILGLSVSTIGAVLAACGGGDTAAPSGGAPAAGDPAAPAAVGPGTPTPAPPPTPVVAQLGKGGTKTVFWHGLGGADGATLQSMLARYAGENPDTSVQSETYAWDVFYQKLPTSVIAKQPPDLAIMHEWAMAQFAGQGLLQDANQLFFDAGIVKKEDFNEAVINQISPNGTPLGVPFDNHGWGMYYNTSLLEKAGVDAAKLPSNGDEWIAACTKITTDASGKHPDESGFDPKKVAVWATHPTWLRPTLLSTMWQFGGGVFDPETKKATLNSDASVRAVQYWHDLIHKHRVSPAPSGQVDAAQFYKNNKLAFWWDGSWTLNFFVDNPKALRVTKAAPLPSLASGDRAAWMSAHILVVPTGATEEQTNRAKDLVKWLLDHNAQWATSGQVPAKLSAQNSGEIEKMWSVNVYAKQFQEFGRTEPPHPQITEIQSHYEPAFDAALNNTKTVKAALDEANGKIQEVLDRA